MNRKTLLIGIGIVIAVIFIYNKTTDLKNKVLPSGDISQEQLSSDKISISPDAIQGKPQVPSLSNFAPTWLPKQ
jgi:hypothetical protein